MTLATRCPACGTVFRVVQDQLRVSQGWVRCGRCAEAFNAMEAMVDWPATQGPEAAADAVLTATQTAAPPPAREPEPEPTSALAGPPADSTAPEAPPPADPAPTPEPAAVPAIELPPGMAVIASDGAVSSEAAFGFQGQDFESPRTDPSFGFDAPPAPTPAPSSPDTESTPAPASAQTTATTALPSPVLVSLPAGSHAVAHLDDAPPSDPADLPSFVLKADRAERWRRPGVRFGLSVVALLAAIGLAAQGVYTFRDRLAAGSPSWRPWLQQACASLGCRVGDYRQIDALSVESTALVKVEGAPVYRLAVTLRNRAALDVAAPAIDLSLTDAQGRQIARRVLQMSDLNLPLRTLKAGSELPIQAPLSIGDRQVSGYTVEIFYP